MAKNRIEHVLVIRLSAMGDVAMTVSVILALVQEYPKLKITVLTKSFYKPILEQIPKVNVHIADVKGEHKGIFGLWKLYRELKKMKIDAVADLHNVYGSILKQFFQVGGIPIVQIDKGRKEKETLTSTANKVFEKLKSMHQRYADVFDQLGYPVDLENDILPKQFLPLEISEKLEIGNVKCIGVAPFAAFVGKTYPSELMEKVIEELNTLKTYKILLFGGGEQEATTGGLGKAIC